MKHIAVPVQALCLSYSSPSLFVKSTLHSNMSVPSRPDNTCNTCHGDYLPRAGAVIDTKVHKNIRD